MILVFLLIWCCWVEWSHVGYLGGLCWAFFFFLKQEVQLDGLWLYWSNIERDCIYRVRSALLLIMIVSCLIFCDESLLDRFEWFPVDYLRKERWIRLRQIMSWYILFCVVVLISLRIQIFQWILSISLSWVLNNLLILFDWEMEEFKNGEIFIMWQARHGITFLDSQRLSSNFSISLRHG